MHKTFTNEDNQEHFKQSPHSTHISPAMTAPDSASADFDLSDAIAEADPLALATPKTNPELRGEPRFRVKWRAIALLEQNIAHHGFVKDISTKGAAFFLEHNLQAVQLITLHIHVPPLDITREPRIVQVEGKLIYSVHDHEELFFRAGFQFIKFKTGSDLDYLRSRLTNHHMEIKD